MIKVIQKELQHMNSYEISQLSPFEKYDILNGFYKHQQYMPLVTNTLSKERLYLSTCFKKTHHDYIIMKNDDDILLPFKQTDIESLIITYINTMKIKKLINI